MKLEQNLVIVYLFIGLAMGAVSDYLHSRVGFVYALAVPFVVYAVSVVALLNFVKERKMRVVILNSLVTFILFWLIVWIFLYTVQTS